MVYEKKLLKKLLNIQRKFEEDFEEHLRTAASEKEALIFDFEILLRIEIWWDFNYFLSIDSLLGFFC